MYVALYMDYISARYIYIKANHLAVKSERKQSSLSQILPKETVSSYLLYNNVYFIYCDTPDYIPLQKGL